MSLIIAKNSRTPSGHMNKLKDYWKKAGRPPPAIHREPIRECPRVEVLPHDPAQVLQPLLIDRVEHRVHIHAGLVGLARDTKLGQIRIIACASVDSRLKAGGHATAQFDFPRVVELSTLIAGDTAWPQ